MYLKRILSIIIVVFILSNLSLLANDNEITWCQPSFPPAAFYDEKGIGHGWANLMINEIIKLTPNYKHRVQDAKLVRFFNEAKNKRNVCHPFLFKTDEREQFLNYSRANFIVLPNGVVIKKDNLAYFKNYINSDGAIELSEVLKNTNLKFGISANMAYGAPLDPLVSEYKDMDHVYVSKIKDSASSLLSMLNAGRIDYTLSYATQLKYRSEKLGLEDVFVYLPVEENSNENLIVYYIACAKTELCDKFIKEVNQKINSEDYITKVSQHYSKWLDQNALQELNRLIKVFIKEEKILKK